MKTSLQTLELDGTLIRPQVRTTSATSPSGTETSFSTLSASNAVEIPLGENVTCSFLICLRGMVT